LSGEMDMSAQQ